MTHRISLSVVVALLSSLLLAAAADDLPDLDKVVEEHKALLESIRTGRITYIEERTRGTDDLEEFKKYYRGELEENVRKAKAAAPDNTMISHYQRQLYDYDASAARALMRCTTRHRITCVFDKDADAVKSDREDLRDIAAMMSRWGLPGEPHRYRWNSSSRLSRDAHKIIGAPRGDRPPHLSISKGYQDQLPISPLHRSGLLQLSTAERYEEDGFEVESRRVYRDADNPDLVIEEVVFSLMTQESAPCVRDGKSVSVMIALEEPVTRKIVTVLDESAHFRKVSKVVYENDRPWIELSYEYASDEVFWLPSTLKFHWYRPDGSVVRTSTTHLESVELNVDIAADELELDIPPGTITTDYRGDKPVTIMPESREEVAEELDDVLEDEGADTSTAEAEEPPAAEVNAPDPVEAVLESAVVETPPRVSRAREDGGGLLITVSLALIAIAIIVGVILWARRRQN